LFQQVVALHCIYMLIILANAVRISSGTSKGTLKAEAFSLSVYSLAIACMKASASAMEASISLISDVMSASTEASSFCNDAMV
jgi:hypothetical protein